MGNPHAPHARMIGSSAETMPLGRGTHSRGRAVPVQVRLPIVDQNELMVAQVLLNHSCKASLSTSTALLGEVGREQGA